MRALISLKIRSLEHLGVLLGTTAREMADITGNPDKYYRSRSIEKKGKRRDLRVPVGRLKTILKRLNALLQRIEMPDYIEGGRRGHDIRTNARRHVNKPLVLTSDIKDCFPSINNRRVYGLFCSRLECSPNVAKVLTELTTTNGSLPQGSPTSSIIAALAAEKLAKRLKGLADKHEADSSMYVDDSSLSGPCHLEKLAKLVKKIGRQEGFAIHKVKSMDSDEEQIVTGVKVNRGIDGTSAKLSEVRNLIEKMTPSHKGTALEQSVKGKVQFLGSLNRGAGKSLRKRLEKRLDGTVSPGVPVEIAKHNGKANPSCSKVIPAT